MQKRPTIFMRSSSVDSDAFPECWCAVSYSYESVLAPREPQRIVQVKALCLAGLDVRANSIWALGKLYGLKYRYLLCLHGNLVGSSGNLAGSKWPPC